MALKCRIHTLRVPVARENGETQRNVVKKTHRKKDPFLSFLTFNETVAN